jgi:thiamine biosynthesis lipoprotein
MNNPEPTIHRLRQEHMATWFEVRLVHDDADYARQAAQAAFAVTARLDRLLNRYRDDSEITQIRSLAPGETLRLSVETFDCLQLAGHVYELSGGAFDPGLGAEMEAWRAEQVVERPKRGRLILDPASCGVRVEGGTVALDLGAIGKGFALDLMAEELRTWDITRALLVAGGSSILALDSPADDVAGWDVALTPARTILLKHGAIGASGTTVQGAHILDPRTGNSASGFFRTWALHPSAAMADALSTAWMVLDRAAIAEVCGRIPGVQAFVQTGEHDVPELIS